MFSFSFLPILFYYTYLFLRLFRTFCYSKLMFDWLQMINQYLWPMSFFRTITKPYFYFWSKILPPIKFKKFRIDISQIFGIELLKNKTGTGSAECLFN